MSSSASVQAALAVATTAYTKLQSDYAQAVESRQRLDAQKSENEAVKKEFAALLPTNAVYKLVGPVLLKQDQTEAKANVENRLELIAGEIKRVEAQLADFEPKLEGKKIEIVHLQTQQQQATQGSTPGAAGQAGAGAGTPRARQVAAP